MVRSCPLHGFSYSTVASSIPSVSEKSQGARDGGIIIKEHKVKNMMRDFSVVNAFDYAQTINCQRDYWRYIHQTTRAFHRA